MIKQFVSMVIICLIVSCQGKKESMKLVLTGDLILDRGVNDEIRLHGDSLFLQSFDLFQEYDYLMVNLEGTLTRSKDKQKDKYNFKNSPERAALLKAAGVTHVSLANNHVFDYGRQGYKETIQSIQNNGMKVMGKETTPQILKKGKHQIAVLSASLTTYNDSLSISSAEKLKESVSNFTHHSPAIPLLLYLHWGLEYQSVPNKWQRKLATELIDLGVDMIVGHHPHVTQSIEYIKNKLVVYSLGNFIADAYLPKTEISYALVLEVKEQELTAQLLPFRLKRYFPQKISNSEQITLLKEQLKYSDVCLNRQMNAWRILPFKFADFSATAAMWLFARKNCIVQVKRLDQDSYLLQFHRNGVSSNVLHLHGRLTDLQMGDINNDMHEDLLLGIYKAVKFDQTYKKRINIYTCKNEALQPLWLGTKFINDVESFEIIHHKSQNFLRTVEVNDRLQKEERIYEWDDFGFALSNLNEQLQ